MKIILQVKHLAQFVNTADKPKNLLDLSGSKTTLIFYSFLEIGVN